MTHSETQDTLQGRLVWINGGSSGIGQASAEALARAGATVIISGRREAQLSAAVEVAQQQGLSLHAVPMDICERESVSRAAVDIEQRFGTVDILVNCAGTNVAHRAWASIDADGFEQVLSANLSGTMYCMLAVLPGMRSQRRGLVINIASWAGKFVSALTGPSYTAAKHAVGALTQSLNTEECVNGIRACAIFPGEVATPMLQTRAVLPTAEEQARMLQPDQVAAAVRFVAEMPAGACINEILMSPTWNRSYAAVARAEAELQTRRQAS
ncbi:SDR family oxidoreductase [Comamonas sp. lk]|uniref:SDR family oxidoreductase n=1 Tax=Comamonas sp. lk TaxID=2201272 RepID=UPI000EAEB5F9|nr:SDR family oxidoreductase [Comamonas sp. lk]